MKKLIVNLILVSLTLLVTVGFSAWYIIYNVELKPEKVTSSILKYFGTSQEVIYNGVEQFPVQKSGLDIETLDPNTLTYSYKLKSDANYTVGKPINANVYDVLIKTNDGRECKVMFTIKPREIRFEKKEIGLDFVKTYRTFQDLETRFKPLIKFVDNIDNSPVTVDFEATNMTNGIKTYTLYSPDNVDGSTYHVNVGLVGLSKQNYSIIGDTFVTLKYKTCLVENVYYTIEDALTKTTTGDIILMGDGTNNKSYVVTSFSKILDTNIYELNNRRILLPFDYGRIEDHFSGYEKPETALDNVYSALIIPEGITLNLKNKATLAIGSVFTAHNTTSQSLIKRRSVVMNHGIINVNATASLLSYGYTKGNGIINVFAGGQVTDVLYLHDWPGGTAALNKFNKCFLSLEWSVHNISCATKVFKEGKYDSVCYVYTSLVAVEVQNIWIIGDSQTQFCMFKPNGGSKDDFIIKSAIIPNDSIEKSNQDITYVNKIILSGDYIDATMKIEVGDIYSFETSTSKAIPISYFDIVLADKTQLTFSSSSYFLYKNTNLIINQGATLFIEGNSFVFCLNNSKITVNGSLSGSGSVSTKTTNDLIPSGNPIDTNNSGASIDISNFNVQNCYIRTGKENQSQISGVSEGYINNFGSIAQFTNKKIYKSYGIDQYYFASIDSVNEFYINFVEFEGENPKPVTYQSAGTTYKVTSNILYTPSKMFYEFVGWYLDNKYTTPFVEHTFTTPKESITLYAKMIPTEYTFTYFTYCNNGSSLEQVNATLSNQNPTFTINDFSAGKLTITTKASYQGKYFNGWYIGVNKDDIPISFVELDRELLSRYLETVGIKNTTIPLYCEFVDQLKYNVGLIKNHSIEKDETLETTSDTLDLSVQTAKLTEYNSKLDHSQYFVGWFTSSGVEFISNQSSISELATNNNLVLHARWLDKACLTINHRDIGLETVIEYHIPNVKIDLLRYKYNDNNLYLSNIYDSNDAVVNSSNYIQILNSNATFDIEYAVDVSISHSGWGAVTVKIDDKNKLGNSGTHRVIVGTQLIVEIGGHLVKPGKAVLTWHNGINNITSNYEGQKRGTIYPTCTITYLAKTIV